MNSKLEGLYFMIALSNLLKFGIWSAEGGWHLQYKNDSNLRREHGATYA